MKRVIKGLSLLMVLVVSSFLFIGCACSEEHEGECKPPGSSMIGKNYQDVKTQFETAGFKNVTTEPIEDLITGWVNKDGAVETVSIDGDDSYSNKKWYKDDAKVVIRYHTFSKDAQNGDGNSTGNNASQEVQNALSKVNSFKDGQSKKDDNVPTEYKNALKKAKSYANNMHMSKRGVYDQLTSEYGEKFSSEAAQYAIDNVDADWNQNALTTAKQYQKTMSMSSGAIYDQLTSEYGEKFTAEEAQYAVDNLNK